MSNGNNSHQFDVEGLKKLIDSLYASKAIVIDDTMPSNVRDEYNRLRAIVSTLYQNEGYSTLVNILKSYPDRSYLPNTIGEYLFGCIDVDPDRVGCLPICNKAILPSNDQYKPCKWPVYKVNANGSIELESRGTNGANGSNDTAVVISATGSLPSAAATALKNSNIRTVHLYREYPNRFVSTLDLSNANPIPPGADLGKKGKDAGKGLKKAGKSSWWTIAAMIVGALALVSLVWYVFGGKNKKNGANGSVNGSAPVETLRPPQYTMGRQYPIRNGGSLFC